MIFVEPKRPRSAAIQMSATSPWSARLPDCTAASKAASNARELAPKACHRLKTIAPPPTSNPPQALPSQCDPRASAPKQCAAPGLDRQLPRAPRPRGAVRSNNHRKARHLCPIPEATRRSHRTTIPAKMAFRPSTTRKARRLRPPWSRTSGTAADKSPTMRVAIQASGPTFPPK